MKILAVNSGSSSLKASLYEMPSGELLINFVFERIGLSDTFYTINYQGEKLKKEVLFKDHEEAIQILLKELITLGVIINLEAIKGIGHRVVHGGDKYQAAVIIDDVVINDIESFKSLAPLHNPPNLVGIRAFKKVLPKTLAVAIFDTSFHQTMPPESYLYAVPYAWYTNYGVRKYGFHGISHQYLSERVSTMLEDSNLNIITCHLGNGGSISAIKKGKCLDTSFGFTPLAGLIMGTRVGDLDVAIVPYLMEQTGMTLKAVMDMLNQESGMLGVSGLSNDFREIEASARDNNERCQLALKMYVQRVMMYITYYYMLLGRVDAIVFAAGVGENSPYIRREIMKRLEPLGVKIDLKLNEVRGKETIISSVDSSVACYVVPTNEGLMMVKEVLKFID